MHYLHRLFCVWLFWMMSSAPAHSLSATLQADVVVGNDTSFGRLVISFEDVTIAPTYTSTDDNNVLVLQFETPFETALKSTSTVLRDFVAVARLDPNQQGLRFSLRRGVTVNIKDAGEQIFVDFLPANWRGLPPALPDNVVRALAERAQAALKAARAAEEAAGASRIRPAIALQVGRLPTLTRLSFTWNRPFNAAFVRDGGEVVINFDLAADFDLGPLLADLPAQINDMTSFIENGQLNFVLSLDEGSNVRSFRDGDAFVVDVTSPLADNAEASDTLVVPGRTLNTAFERAAVPPGASVSESLGKAGPDGSGPSAQSVSTVGPELGMDLADGPNTNPVAMVQTDLLSELLGQNQAQPVLPLETPGEDAVPDRSESLSRGDFRVLNPEAVSSNRTELDFGEIFIDARYEDDQLSFVFPFDEPTAAAMFETASSHWMVFDTDAALQLDLAKAIGSSAGVNMAMRRIPDGVMLRLDLPDLAFAQLSKLRNGWLLLVGDQVAEVGVPLQPIANVDSEGRSQLRVPMENLGRIRDMRLPNSGDQLMIATSFGPQQSMLRPQAYVDLQFLSSVHGIAVVPRVDDLQVQHKDGVISIGRQNGLSLSSSANSTALKFHNALNVNSGPLGSNSSDGFAGFDALSDAGLAPRGVSQSFTAAERGIALSALGQRDTKRLDLAKFLVGQGLVHEALGMLHLAVQDNPALENTPEVLLLHGIAQALAGRPDIAEQALDSQFLIESPDAAFWRVIVGADLANWSDVYLWIRRGQAVLGAYPLAHQHRFQLAAIAVALNHGDRGLANKLLSEMDPSSLGDQRLAEYLILRGQVAQAAGSDDQAVRSFQNALRVNHPLTNARAELMLLKHQFDEGDADPDALIPELASLNMRWRGDETELDGLRLLSRLHNQQGAFREAFQVMKTAVLADQGSNASRELQDEISRQFEDLFLHGAASKLPPIESLALYYDFRELTPVGAKGDEIIRKLAARLIDVDLLPQAIQLLSHQVDNRLSGAARAQIAADLAFVYLLNKQPNLALQAIRRSHQSELPTRVERQRRLLEAKALAAIDKPDLAVELIDRLEGRDVDRLLAGVYWDAEDWQNAGNVFERLTGESWADPLPLNDVTRLDVLKAGTAFSLADDVLGLQRLRLKFAEKMSQSPDAAAFDIVTARDDLRGFEFRTLSRSLDTSTIARSFLADYRRRYLAPGVEELVGDAVRQNEQGLAMGGEGA